MTVYPIAGMTDPYSCTVAFYRCLTPSKPTWSIRAMDGADKGRVIGYADTATLTDCRFVVQTRQWETIVAGLSKRGRKRNVIAWVVGKLADGAVVVPNPVRVDFNFYPERAPEGMPSGVFYRTDTGAPVTGCDAVSFSTTPDGHGLAHIAG